MNNKPKYNKDTKYYPKRDTLINGEKLCRGKCMKWLPVEEYDADTRTKDKLKIRCRKCETERVMRKSGPKKGKTKRKSMVKEAGHLLIKRPTLYGSIVNLTKEGSSMSDISRKLKLGSGTLENWFRNGRKMLDELPDDYDYDELHIEAKLLLDCDEARADEINRLIVEMDKLALNTDLKDSQGNVIHTPANVRQKAIEFRLKRLDPERFGDQVQVIVQQKIDKELDNFLNQLEAQFRNQQFVSLEEIYDLVGGMKSKAHQLPAETNPHIIDADYEVIEN